MLMWFRWWLLRLSVPVQKFIQTLHPPYAQTTYAEAVKALTLMRSGDILVSREKWHFTNIFIPGFWSHAAIFGGNNEVIESVAPVVQRVSFVDWVVEKHFWCVIRYEHPAIEISNAVGEAAFLHANGTIGSPYDYFFDWTASGQKHPAFYCSRLVYSSLAMASQAFANCFNLRPTFGQLTVTPDDFYNACQSGKLKIIYEHRDKDE